MMTDGVIHYDIHYTEAPSLTLEQVKELNHYRSLFYELGLIGVDVNGIGFGNLSQRVDEGESFIITGTQTGHLPALGPEHYSLVTAYQLERHALYCQGPIKASSEALSHAALYHSSPEIKAVLHMHQKLLWEKFLYRLPTTAAEAEYGTSAMVKEIQRLFMDSKLIEVKTLLMAGHENGLICFGDSLEDIYQRVVLLLQA